VVHELEVLPEDVLEGLPPVDEGLLPGHDLEGPELVDPAVPDAAGLGVDLLGEVDRGAARGVVEHAVPGLVEVAEDRVGDEDRPEEVVLGGEGDDHPPAGDVQRLRRPGPEQPSGERGQEDGPALGQEREEGVRPEHEAAHRHGGGAEGRGEGPPADRLQQARAGGGVVLGDQGLPVHPLDGLVLHVLVDAVEVGAGRRVLRRHP